MTKTHVQLNKSKNGTHKEEKPMRFLSLKSARRKRKEKTDLEERGYFEAVEQGSRLMEEKLGELYPYEKEFPRDENKALEYLPFSA